MPDLTHRFSGQERMDDLNASGSDLVRALKELDAINYLLGGNAVTLRGIARLLPARVQGRLHIADLGCGSGDMLRRIRAMLSKRSINPTLTGIDANPNVVRFAVENTPSSCGINYQALNILAPEFTGLRFDIVTATLFFHHFDDETLTGIVRNLMSQVTVGAVINDIHRHWFAYYSIRILTRLFSRSPMVKNDAPVSVMRSFTRKELEDILRRAGVTAFTIRWRWAFRWQVIIWAAEGPSTAPGR